MVLMIVNVSEQDGFDIFVFVSLIVHRAEHFMFLLLSGFLPSSMPKPGHKLLVKTYGSDHV